MLKPFSLILLFWLSLGMAIAAKAQEFIEPLDDIPLMQGMRVNSASILILESASGRVIELSANIPSWSRAKQFYQDSLPSLGWRQESENHMQLRFSRAGETLYLNRQGQLLMFQLAPTE